MSRSFAQVSLLALTVGFAAFGSSPAAARTSVHPGNIRLPSAQTGPGASMHPISEKIHLPQVVTAPGASKYPVGAKIHVVSGVQNAPGASIYPGGGAKTVPGVQTAPGASIYPGGGGAKTVPNVQTVPGISIYPGKLKTPDPIPNIGGGVDNVCPFNKFKCPPKPPAGPGSAGNPTPGPGPAGPVVVWLRRRCIRRLCRYTKRRSPSSPQPMPRRRRCTRLRDPTSPPPARRPATA